MIEIRKHLKYPKKIITESKYKLNFIYFLESVDDNLEDICCTAGRQRRCSLPCKGEPLSSSSPVTRTVNSRRIKNSLQVSTVPGYNEIWRGSSGGKQNLDFGGGVVHETLSKSRRVSGGSDRRRVSAGSSSHSRHSSLTDEPIISEVIHEVPHGADVDLYEAVIGKHRRHVSDCNGNGQPPPMKGVENLAKKVEAVSYPGGTRDGVKLVRGQKFHAHDDIMPLVEDWYDSWEMMGNKPITDPGNIAYSGNVVR